MALISLKLPMQLATLLQRLDVGLETPPYFPESVAHMHVSLAYFEQEPGPDEVAHMFHCISELNHRTQPIQFEVTGLSSFPGNPVKGRPILAKVKSERLYQYRKDLVHMFDKEHIAYSKKFPEFKAHITLGWAQVDKFEDRTLKSPLAATAQDVEVWLGSDYNNGKTLILPFADPEFEEKTARALLRTAKIFMDHAKGVRKEASVSSARKEDELGRSKPTKRG
jgi:2'-5' RNA ligase